MSKYLSDRLGFGLSRLREYSRDLDSSLERGTEESSVRNKQSQQQYFLKYNTSATFNFFLSEAKSWPMNPF